MTTVTDNDGEDCDDDDDDDCEGDEGFTYDMTRRVASASAD